MTHLTLRLSKLAGAVALVLVATAAFIARQDQPIDPLTPVPTIPIAMPDAQAPVGLRFAILPTAHSAGAPEGLLVAGGSWLKNRQLVQNAVLIEHPQGNLLFDTGLGREARQQFQVNSWFDQQLLAFDALNPVLDQLLKHGLAASHINRIIPSHMHWDHVSALPEFPEAEVWVAPKERQGAEGGVAPAFLNSQFEHVTHWHDLDMSGPSYMGFAHSQDVFADGSVVLVPLSGHTAGQVGLFLTLASGKRYFFTGDVSWTLEGFQWGADRSWLLQQFLSVDKDSAANQPLIMHIHRLMQAHPELIVVPAHDENVARMLPNFPMFES